MSNIFRLISDGLYDQAVHEIESTKALDLLQEPAGPFSRTLLIAATLEGATDVVATLLKRGVRINHKDHFKFKAIDYAASKGYDDIAILITKHQKAEQDRIFQPSYWARRAGHSHLAKHLAKTEDRTDKIKAVRL